MIKKIITIFAAIFMLNACSTNHNKHGHKHHMHEKHIYFATKSAKLSKEAMSELDMFAKDIEKHHHKHVVVYGHASKKEKSSLSKERAEAVVAYLKEKDVKSEIKVEDLGHKRSKHKKHGNKLVTVVAE